MDLDDAIDALAMLRMASRQGAQLPYQPLVLLWAAERAATEDTRLTRWSHARADLAAMLATNSDQDQGRAAPEYPVVALRHSPLWEIEANSPPPPAHSSQPRRWLDREDPAFGLSAPAFELLRDGQSRERFVTALREVVEQSRPLTADLAQRHDAPAPVVSDGEDRAWSLLTIDESERQFSGNLGYADVLGSTYVWDSTVANHRAVQAGSLAVLRDNRMVLGTGWIDEVGTTTSTKIRRRCPSCGATSFKTRHTVTPRYKCSPCGTTFNTPSEEQINVTVYVADYGRTWRPAESLTVASLELVYLNRSKQQSIRPLNFARLQPIISASAGLGERWWTDAIPAHVPGGHGMVIGKVRIGQTRFRAALRQRFGDVCAITGLQPPDAIEAAHLYRYSDTPVHDLSGGLLLRRDLHALFDHFQVTIDAETWTVRVAPSLTGDFPDLAKLDGAPLAIPPHLRPRSDYLRVHMAWALDQWAAHPA
ncbi:HNH endonuclease [Frankia sp. AgB1.9]|uniref:HNH endonuclease n=1 Tax=unclassified Frankia TaxID=2632575 RepID=UPI0019335778|nr:MULTISPECIES: HNH endonuclease [unclassified Frankia]MBL7489318.1 HNH endonuclease [Frankia sp. AgW1.1]MBL7553100.1 HNH endonuclease [Frankia sp. AgB1.9]MBL7623085.1 HNH endonuclease [Frankia sp. AgB1.8]